MYGFIGFHITSKAEAIIRAKILLQMRPIGSGNRIQRAKLQKETEDEENGSSEQGGNFMAENKSLYSVCAIHLIKL